MMRSILSAEWQKRSSLNLLISILMPFLVFVLIGVGFAGNALGDEIDKTWETLLLQMNMALLFFFPLGVTLLCSNLANVEHQANSWKVILALPLKKEHAYFGKLIYVMGYSIFTAILLFLGITLLGLWLDLSDLENVPLILVFKQVFYPIVGSFSIMSFQLFLSMFIRNQAFPIMIGVVTSIFTYSLLIFPSTISQWLFWTYPTLASPLKPIFEEGGFSGVTIANNAELYLLLSLIVGATISFISAKRFAKRDVN